MSQHGTTHRRTWGEPEPKKNSRNSGNSQNSLPPLRAEAEQFSQNSLPEGESGSIRENKNAILPGLSHGIKNNLCKSRENRESFSPSYTYVGAMCAHDTKVHRAGETPKYPKTPSLEQALWAALIEREDIRAIARRLGLPADGVSGSYRLTVLRIARSERFFEARPPDTSLRQEDWQRWCSLQESPRKMLDLLRKLIYGVRIWD